MNTIKLPVSDLKEALTGLAKIVSRKSTLPVLQHLRVSRDSKGSVSIQATDLDTFVTYHTEEAQIGPVVDLLMPMDQLSKAVKSSGSKDSISLVIEPKDKVRMQYSLGGSPVEQAVLTLPVKEWPPVPEISQTTMALDKEFGSALKEALECTSEDSTRYAIQGACLDVGDKKCHYVVGTNGRMLYSANSFCFDLKESVIIPRSRFLTSSDFLEQEGGLLSAEKIKHTSWVKLQSPRWSYISKQIDAKFPNWKQVVPTYGDKATRILLNEPALKQLMNVAPRLPGDNDENRPVRIRFDAQAVFIEGRAKDQKEWTSIRLQEAVAKGRHVEVQLNREYLVMALRFGLKQVEIEDELSPVIFWNAGKKMVVMPLKPDNTPATAPATPAPAKPAEQKSSPTNTQPTTQTNERKTMPRQASRIQTPVNGEANNNPPANGSALNAAVAQIETVRTGLRDVLGGLNTTLDLLRAAEREKKASAREVDSVRATLRGLQKLAI